VEDNCERDAAHREEIAHQANQEDHLQAPTLNQRFAPKFQKLCNSITSEADCVKSCNIAKQELRVRVDFDFLTALPESPFVGAPGLRVPKLNQAMIALLKLRGMNWTARFLQISR
jgi:hypothetical protein